DQLLRISSSAAAMWTANAATAIPSADATDHRVHLVPANLTAMFHRSLEAETTARVLRAIFADAQRFEVHDPLPGGGHFSDEGAFHTAVLAVGNANLLLLHEFAFVDSEGLLKKLRELLGSSFIAVLATESELPVASAVAAYPFNSQLLTIPDGSMAIVAPEESREDPHARAWLQRLVESGGPVKSVHYLDLRESMENGGGPACLRQRI